MTRTDLKIHLSTMNKVKTFFLLISIVILSSCKRSNKQIEKIKINNIKSYYTETYRQDQVENNNDGKLKFEVSIKTDFNENGNIIKETYNRENYDGKIETRVIQYYYDKNQNLIKKESGSPLKVYQYDIYTFHKKDKPDEFIRINKDKDTIEVIKYMYSNNDNPIGRKYRVKYSDKWEIIEKYKYDEKNRMIESQYLGSLESKHIFFYDRFDNIIKECLYNKQNRIETSWHRKYDDYGNKTEEKRLFHPGNTLSYIEKYTYDNYHNLISESGSGPDRSQKMTYSYKYDENKNWIEKKTYNTNGTLYEKTKRIIKYRTLPNKSYN